MAKNIILLGGSGFFAKVIDVPSGLSAEDLCGLAETTVAISAPVSIDKLRCGYVRKENADTALAFGGIESNLQDTVSPEDMLTAEVVAPIFSIVPFVNLSDGKYFLRADDSVSAIKIDGGNVVECVSISANGDFAKAEESLAVLCNSSFEGAKTIEILSVGIEKKFALVSYRIDSAEESQWKIPLKMLSSADMRGAGFKKLAVKARAKAFVKKASIWALPCLFVGLLAYQVAIILKGNKLERLQAHLVQIEPVAKEVEIRAERASELDALFKSKPRGLSAVAILNKVRPEGMVFTKIAISGKAVELRGEAPEINKINEFLHALRQSQAVSDIRPKTESAHGGAKFTIFLNLK